MAGIPEKRKKPGTFEKGQIPNPGGRPKGYPEFRQLCRDHTSEAVKKLVLALNKSQTVVAAAKVLLEFGWGRATQYAQVEHSFPEMTDEQLETKYRALLAKGSTSAGLIGGGPAGVGPEEPAEHLHAGKPQHPPPGGE